MKKILSLIAFVAILSSCGNVNKIDFKEVDHIFIDYNTNEPNNYNTEINARICFKTTLGEIIPIETKKSVKTGNNVHFDLNGETIKVISEPKDFNDSIVIVDIKVSNKNGEFIEGKDTIVLNYQEGISLGGTARKGNSGGSGENGGTSLLFRYGKDGDNGTHGQNGANGDDYTVRIWRHLEFYLIEVNNTSLGSTKNYQVNGLQSFSLTSNGGRGGNGGNGGNGGDGKDGIKTEKKTKSPGSGGNAGLGGSGGFGGNGGNITCIIHSNAQEFQALVKLKAKAGNGGSSGRTGAPGKGGSPLTGTSQTHGTDGSPGTDGNSGQRGRNGVVSINVQNFELK